jgi:hypothetical protein
MQTDWVSTVNTLSERSTGLPDPLHDAEDHDKITALANSLSAIGWQGAPLVVDGEQAITGSHRIAALAQLCNRDGIDIPAPRIQIADLFTAAGLDWPAHLAEHDADRGYWQWYQAACAAGAALPAELAAYLGLDAH